MKALRWFVLFFLFTFCLGGITLFGHSRPRAAVASRPVPGLDLSHPANLETATFALG